MKGWKTWLSALGYFALAAFGFYTKAFTLETALGLVTTGIGFIGIGHKIEKQTKSVYEKTEKESKEASTIYKVLSEELASFSSLRDNDNDVGWEDAVMTSLSDGIRNTPPRKSAIPRKQKTNKFGRPVDESGERPVDDDPLFYEVEIPESPLFEKVSSVTNSNVNLEKVAPIWDDDSGKDSESAVENTTTSINASSSVIRSVSRSDDDGFGDSTDDGGSTQD